MDTSYYGSATGPPLDVNSTNPLNELQYGPQPPNITYSWSATTQHHIL
jgi:hypothetical protein